MIEFELKGGAPLAVNPQLVKAIFNATGGGTFLYLDGDDEGFVVTTTYKDTLYQIQVALDGER